ncbi:MAG: zinc ribbon domain-containing protein [Thermoplasmata archaeon]
MLLERYETILFTKHEVVVNEQTGTFYVTNKRILFETQILKQGRFGQKEKMQSVIAEEIRYEDLMDATVDDSVKPSQLKIVASKGIVMVSTSDPDQLRAYITKAKGFKGSSSGFLDKSIVVKVRCPYCNSMVDSNLPKCPYCGAPLER